MSNEDAEWIDITTVDDCYQIEMAGVGDTLRYRHRLKKVPEKFGDDLWAVLPWTAGLPVREQTSGQKL